MQEKKKKGKNSKYSQGITLVALVITIIVLIILAGISINLVLGENGLFNRAKQAAEEYKQAAINEQAMLNSVDEEIVNAVGENPTTNSQKTIEEAKTEEKYFDEETTLKDSNGNKVVVPKDFKIAEDSGNNVTDGIVIEDSDIQNGVGEGRGNQYVWIPVSNIDNKGSNPIIKSNGEEIEITLGRYTFEENGKEQLVQNAEDYTEETLISSHYQELEKFREGKESSKTDGENRTAKDLAGFIKSVKENGGYYIARYEASYGKDGKPNSKISTSYSDSSAPTQEGTLWNFITQIDAAKACDNMYDTVSSDLINSYAWDTAIVYIQKFSEDRDYSRQDGISINANLANTGANKDEVCKIHDMASNCFEWTTEYSAGTYGSSAIPCVIRGGYWYDGEGNTSFRYDFSATSEDMYYTFRPTLYISFCG